MYIMTMANMTNHAARVEFPTLLAIMRKGYVKRRIQSFESFS